MTAPAVSTPDVNTSNAVEFYRIMSHSDIESCRDIGRLYMTLHKISIINRAREAKCINS